MRSRSREDCYRLDPAEVRSCLRKSRYGAITRISLRSRIRVYALRTSSRWHLQARSHTAPRTSLQQEPKPLLQSGVSTPPLTGLCCLHPIHASTYPSAHLQPRWIFSSAKSPQVSRSTPCTHPRRYLHRSCTAEMRFVSEFVDEGMYSMTMCERRRSMAATLKRVNELLNARGEQGVRTVMSRGDKDQTSQMVEMAKNVVETLRRASGLLEAQVWKDAEAVMAR
jgi:hypothetical protein